MELGKTVDSKAVTITNRGMITIPSGFRKRFNLKDGNKVFIIEDEGSLRIIPIKSEEELRKDSYSAEEMLKSMEQSKKEELEQEDK
ncbi:MAG: hypothetical protein RBG13Loki_1737 [Promethearchaeota archaeon CR_4]|nr:MAG: hypothetical protein RBG13Loki_1737 [Candidatus Lokiarchaeota archaeon CR_4]